MTKPDFDAATDKARKGVFAVLAQAGIKSRNDRLELAADILNMRVDSFADLTKDDFLDLHFGLQAWKRVQDVRSANGALLKEAEDMVEGIHEIDISEVTRKRAEELPYQGDYDDENRY